MRLACLPAALLSASLFAAPTPKWGRHEIVLKSAADVANPSSADVLAEFRSPSGAARTVRGFWDGGRVWRVRFAPDAEGKWTWSTRGPDRGLTRKGSFVCAGVSRALLPIEVGKDRRRLARADGTPFFWFADTAWNGPLLATDEDWRLYLDKRRRQGFTAIQWVTGHWRGSPTGDARGGMPYTGANPIRIDPEFFRRLEGRHEAILRAGMVSAPVMLWAIATRQGSEVNPGLSLSESDAILLARYVLARWDADPVLWLLNGDGDYRGPKAERWKRIGRGVFDGVRHAPVSLHSGGLMWVMDEFREEKWLDIAGYQSAHGDSVRNSAWIHSGPPAQEWRREPARPVISLEAPYDRAPDAKTPAPEALVRRNHLWSLLNAPVAGVTYGVHGVWGWSDGAHPAPGHGATAWPAWRTLLDLPGATQTARLCGLLQSLDWTRLAPAPEALDAQPGGSDPAAFVSVAQTPSRQTVVYTPVARKLRLRSAALPASCEGEWVNAASGEKARAEGKASGEAVEFETPAPGDWLLILRPKPARP
jgi:hypothetical protein